MAKSANGDNTPKENNREVINAGNKYYKLPASGTPIKLGDKVEVAITEEYIKKVGNKFMNVGDVIMVERPLAATLEKQGLVTAPKDSKK